MKSPCPGSALAFAALASAQAAHAQDVCVEAEDAADAVVYLTPLAYDAAKTTCADVLPSENFLFSPAGESFVESFRAQQDERWGGTINLFRVFMAKEQGGQDAMGDIISQLPDDALRPLIDGIMEPIISKEIKPDSCAKIDRIVELLSPLPPENFGDLIAFILPEVDVKDPPICGTTSEPLYPGIIAIPEPAPAPAPVPEPRAESGN